MKTFLEWNNETQNEMTAYSGSTLAMYIKVKSFIGFQILSEYSSSDFCWV